MPKSRCPQALGCGLSDGQLLLGDTHKFFKECNAWEPLAKDTFLDPRSQYSSILACEQTSCDATGGTHNNGTFMQASNMSIEEMALGYPMPN